MERHRDEQSLGELFGEFTAEMRTLVRDEVDLAKAEMTGKLTQVKRDIAYLAVGGLIAYAGLLGLIAFFIIVIGDAMPLWASALIVSIVAGG
ncbi:MAG: phage holin family protein, partial [Syntrophaceae bacterium]